MTDANSAFLNPTVPFVNLLDGVLGLKVRLHSLQSSRLIPLECAQVMIMALHDSLSRFFEY
jgi:hypothetical protein